MLRRVLIPFSELFILLTLVFLTLFFVSAALSGRGEDRPSDALHLITISASRGIALTRRPSSEPPYPWPSRSLLAEPQPWPGSDDFLTFSATSVAGFEEQVWEGTWPPDDLELGYAEWQSVRLDGTDGACTSLADAARDDAELMSYQKQNHPPANRIESLIGHIAGLRSRLTVHTDLTYFQQEYPDPESPQGPSILQAMFLRSTLYLAYQPHDLQNRIILEVTLSPKRALAYLDLTGRTSPRDAITFRHFELLSGDETRGALVLESILDFTWNENGAIRQAPIYYSSAECFELQSARLFVILSADGPTFTPYDPRIQR